MIKYILLLTTVSLLQACATGPKISQSDFLSDNPTSDVRIGNVTTHHHGSTKGRMTGMVTAGLIGETIGKAAGKSGIPVSYETSLTEECKKTIADTINASQHFSVIDGTPDLRLDMHIRFEAVANTIFTISPVAMIVEWELFDTTSDSIYLEAMTIVQADSGPDKLPNTRDPKYFDNYVILAERNAEDFLALLNGETPKWGKDSLRLY